VNFEAIRKIYFIGICGTAMASLAGLLKEKGYDVCGSDSNVYPPMSAQLEALGIRLYNGYQPQNLSAAVPDIVIPGNAIPRGNPELEEMLNRRMPYLSMAEAVREFFLREKLPLVVAGTHGKTTTTALTAWALEAAGAQPSFLVGGIPINFGRSFQWNPPGKHFVIEGDEYDTGFMDRRPKFVQYLPHIVILNAVEFDHADLYPDFAAVENAFWQLIKVVPASGYLIVNRDNEAAMALARRGYSHVISFGFHEESDYRIHSFKWEDGVGRFLLNDQEYRVPVLGKHNLANASAAAVCAQQLGISSSQVASGLAAFRGVKRRMELRGESRGIYIYDDFAHHPSAIDATLEGARRGFPGSRIWAVFEPRSWSSRRNVFQNQFAKAFRHADRAIIAGVFEPEKVPLDLRLDPHKLAADITAFGTPCEYIDDTPRLIESIVQNAKPGDRVLLMSNGSFDNIHERILERL
jgi:UDP-N-acetylmuramate: L-alanyl-gamma-D-glutamyl-meso-diaminopimelate ligase